MNLPFFTWTKKFLNVVLNPPKPMEKLIFEDRLKESLLKCKVEDFVKKVKDVSADLGIPPNWLMVAMDIETASTFNPAITNSLGYTGLIQFGTVAAKELGTTTAKLRKMNGVEQLDYVYRYLKRYKSKFKSLQDVYLSILFPIAVGKPDNWIIQSSGIPAEKFAKWNPFDIDGDKKVQIWEVRQKLMNRIPKEFKDKI